MKQDAEGNLVHESFDDSFEYDGTIFIVDYLDDQVLVTERNFMVKGRGADLEEAKKHAIQSWENYKKTK